MCPAALSSLHVRARMGCASAASSALACTQQLVAVPEERKPSAGRSHAPSPSPSWDHVGRIQALIYHPRCDPTGKIFQHFCVSRFFPRKGTEMAAELYGSTCPHARARTRTATAATGVMGKFTLPKHTRHSGGSVTSFLRGVYQGRTLSSKHDTTQMISLQAMWIPTALSPLVALKTAVGKQCEAGECRYLAAYKTAALIGFS